MATLKSKLSISNVIEPVWENEKRIPIRAIWEIAALAGNVHPSRENVKETLNKSTDSKASALQTNDDTKHISSRRI